MRILIPGKPIPQQRHRHRVLGKGKVWAYDPLAREKALLKRELQAMIEGKDFTPFKIPDVEFIFYMPIPKSMRKAKREYANGEVLRHLVKPDVDNLVKLYLDCMTKIIIEDDRSVKIVGAQKLYSPEPRTVIIIREGQEIPTILGNKPRHDEFDSLVCGTPTKATMSVPPYSESPYYSGIPQLADTYNALKNKESPSE